MALVLRLERRTLPPAIKAIFEDVEKGKGELVIPAMVAAEIGYLSEKKKIETDLTAVSEYAAKHKTVSVYPITYDVIKSTFQIKDIPELHDSMIAATAMFLGVELLTNDTIVIQSRHVKTLW
jgi:predicted nucleic acid-binding protein